MKHLEDIEKCRHHARQMEKMAQLVEQRCQSFELVCCHEHLFDGGLPQVHVYDLEAAKREFGFTGWTLRGDGSDTLIKIIDGVAVSAS